VHARGRRGTATTSSERNAIETARPKVHGEINQLAMSTKRVYEEVTRRFVGKWTVAESDGNPRVNLQLIKLTDGVSE